LSDVACWTDLNRALVESDAEAWIVATSTAAHVPVTKTLLAAGKTVLLEKAIAEDLAAAESLEPLIKPDSGSCRTKPRGGDQLTLSTPFGTGPQPRARRIPRQRSFPPDDGLPP